jgi:hypothetical protein
LCRFSIVKHQPGVALITYRDTAQCRPFILSKGRIRLAGMRTSRRIPRMFHSSLQLRGVLLTPLRENSLTRHLRFTHSRDPSTPRRAAYFQMNSARAALRMTELEGILCGRSEADHSDLSLRSRFQKKTLLTTPGKRSRAPAAGPSCSRRLSRIQACWPPRYLRDTAAASAGCRSPGCA